MRNLTDILNEGLFGGSKHKAPKGTTAWKDLSDGWEWPLFEISHFNGGNTIKVYRCKLASIKSDSTGKSFILASSKTEKDEFAVMKHRLDTSAVAYNDWGEVEVWAHPTDEDAERVANVIDADGYVVVCDEDFANKLIRLLEDDQYKIEYV